MGVLVAVSIPIFTSQLRKARVATDQANARAAKAAAVTAALNADEGKTATELVYKYDAQDGVAYISTETHTYKAYGKTSDAKATDGIEGVTADDNLTTKIVQVTIGTDNKVTVAWVTA